MNVIAVSTLRNFWLSQPDSEQPLKSWHQEVVHANWSGPSDLKAQFRSASILKAGRVVFNISGNRFRLVCQIAYQTKWVFVKFVGTHEQYDQIDAQTIEHGGKK